MDTHIKWPEVDPHAVSEAGLIANRIADIIGVGHEHSTTVIDILLTVHAQCPLNLARMATEDDLLIFTDVQLMSKHLDRETGILRNGYVPFFAM